MAGAFGRADALYRAQQETLTTFWENADTTILGDDDTNLSMQFNLYMLFQSPVATGCAALRPRVCRAKGMKGTTSGIRKCT